MTDHRVPRLAQHGTLPSSSDRLVHPAWRHRLRRTRHTDPCAGVHNGDRIANPCSSGLVKLQCRWRTVICGAGDIGRSVGVQGESRSNDLLRMLSWRGFGRRTWRGAIGRWRRCRINRDPVALSQQCGAKFSVVIQIKRPASFEFLAKEGDFVRRFSHILHTPHASECVPLAVLRGGQSGSTAGSAVVGGGLRSRRNGIVVSIVVKVIRRHYRLMNGEVLEAGGWMRCGVAVEALTMLC